VSVENFYLLVPAVRERAPGVFFDFDYVIYSHADNGVYGEDNLCDSYVQQFSFFYSVGELVFDGMYILILS
jgi:hypothetical protein